ncbi:hypothetical protein LYSHEL_25560 [Lysobacter helvus]|uniref:Uncharacterized protein n=2 Tax=Lysobacteraceae TaxID=32033 RepID=A0ABM7Q860_9GAMM|nr:MULTISPECIES: hypothetical protein [Lysobacter]BCT93532.1 hypothetical protein LYSCAS_25560 [Lysobacter caseinilyticus]BCT96685.1 hypothetical protein LYSHEL_25560 [Lysobacter helvus]
MNSSADIRGSLLGLQIVLGAMIESHPDLKAFASALERHSQIMLKTAGAVPGDMLHPAERIIEECATLAGRLIRAQGEG